MGPATGSRALRCVDLTMTLAGVAFDQVATVLSRTKLASCGILMIATLAHLTLRWATLTAGGVAVATEPWHVVGVVGQRGGVRLRGEFGRGRVTSDTGAKLRLAGPTSGDRARQR